MHQNIANKLAVIKRFGGVWKGKQLKIMSMKKFYLTLFSIIFILSAVIGASAQKRNEGKAKINEPLNLAILIQDDLVSRVGNELKVTKEFIHSLPKGSQVMVAYITSNTLQIRQKFTTDLDSAANSLRVPVGQQSASSYDPYNQVLEALKLFDANQKNSNAILLVSDGLDLSEGYDGASILNSIDLNRSIKRAKEKDVTIYSFYAPAVGLSSNNRTFAFYGQGALSKISKETGGQAFFQGTSFVTFDSYFDRLRRALIERNEGAA